MFGRLGDWVFGNQPSQRRTLGEQGAGQAFGFDIPKGCEPKYKSKEARKEEGKAKKKSVGKNSRYKKMKIQILYWQGYF